jgi:hypothetical protein
MDRDLCTKQSPAAIFVRDGELENRWRRGIELRNVCRREAHERAAVQDAFDPQRRIHTVILIRRELPHVGVPAGSYR